MVGAVFPHRPRWADPAAGRSPLAASSVRRGAGGGRPRSLSRCSRWWRDRGCDRCASGVFRPARNGWVGCGNDWEEVGDDKLVQPGQIAAVAPRERDSLARRGVGAVAGPRPDSAAKTGTHTTLGGERSHNLTNLATFDFWPRTGLASASPATPEPQTPKRGGHDVSRDYSARTRSTKAVRCGGTVRLRPIGLARWPGPRRPCRSSS